MRCNDLHLLARQMGTSIAMIEQSTTDRSGRKRHVKNWQASMGIPFRPLIEQVSILFLSSTVWWIFAKSADVCRACYREAVGNRKRVRKSLRGYSVIEQIWRYALVAIL